MNRNEEHFVSPFIIVEPIILYICKIKLPERLVGTHNTRFSHMNLQNVYMRF